MLLVTASFSQTGLWVGTDKSVKNFYAEILFHAELGYWQFELDLRLRKNPEVELSRREFEGTYLRIDDSTLILYTKKLFVNGFPIPLDKETKKQMTYSFMVFSPGVGGFGIVKNNKAYRKYTLYKKGL